MSAYIVRFGITRLLGKFTTSDTTSLLPGASVIVRTDRGLEAGTVLRAFHPEPHQEPSTADAVGLPQESRESENSTQKTNATAVDRATVDATTTVDAAALVVASTFSDATLTFSIDGVLLRSQTPDDIRELEKIHTREKEEFQICLRAIRRLQLAMHLIRVEHLFGGERVIVYYLADDRIDFRELVRVLAGEFQTRVEMRQIGVRDEAKLLSDYGDCGKVICCNTHLVEIPPVSMKMAKLQKATLDPTKISGRCGRLKCCLRYEYDMYEEMLQSFPPIGSRVQTPDGPARVVGHEILMEQLCIEMLDERRRRLIALKDVRWGGEIRQSGDGQRGGDGQRSRCRCECQTSQPVPLECAETLPKNATRTAQPETEKISERQYQDERQDERQRPERRSRRSERRSWNSESVAPSRDPSEAERVMDALFEKRPNASTSLPASLPSVVSSEPSSKMASRTRESAHSADLPESKPAFPGVLASGDGVESPMEGTSLEMTQVALFVETSETVSKDLFVPLEPPNPPESPSERSAKPRGGHKHRGRSSRRRSSNH